MFERPITFRHGDGSHQRRAHRLLPARPLRAGGQEAQGRPGRAPKGFDDALLRARTQAEGYARALPAAEGRPPFVLVVDVGNVIEVYAEFSRSGGTYTPFPDPRSHRIKLADLAEPEVRHACAPSGPTPQPGPRRASARVTREVAASWPAGQKLEARAGHTPTTSPAFLTRCLFSMFAEDVELLPKGAAFRPAANPPRTARHAAADAAHPVGRHGPRRLQRRAGRRRAALQRQAVQGRHASDGYSLLLTTEQIDLLITAARANWREVEPAIFGTLLERALDPTERHALGAHYTPRAYVERLVLPTVIEPLRADWANAQAAAMVLAHEAAELEWQGPRRQAGRSPRRDASRWPTSKLSPPAVHHPRAGPGLRQRQLPVRHAGAPQAPGGRSAQPARSPGPHRRTSRTAWAWRARPSRCSSCAASSSTSAPPPWPSWCCGSAGCSGTSAPAATRPPWPSPWCTTTATSNAATPCWPGTRRSPPRRPRPACSPAGTARPSRRTRSPASRARRSRPGAAVALREPRKAAQWPQADFHRGQPAVHWRKHHARGAGRRLCAGPARRLARRARERRLRHVLVAHAAALVANGQARAHGPDHHQQPAPDVQPPVVQAALGPPEFFCGANAGCLIARASSWHGAGFIVDAAMKPRTLRAGLDAVPGAPRARIPERPRSDQMRRAASIVIDLFG
jgi:hypothetical protein